MTYSAEFQNWFESNYPNLHRAASGLGCWSPEQRRSAAMEKQQLHREWLANKNEQDGAQ